MSRFLGYLLKLAFSSSYAPSLVVNTEYMNAWLSFGETQASLDSSATLTQAGTCFTSLYLPPWTSRPNKQKQLGFSGSTWRGLRRSDGRLLVHQHLTAMLVGLSEWTARHK
ncbi:MAG: hypothetical protein LBI43_00715 [Streptococcaceae bacterium]|nr:hypothetical protein [Streptococcaceae bacterium]